MEGEAAATLFYVANSFPLSPQEKIEALQAAAETIASLVELEHKLGDGTVIQVPAIGV
jgi:hypothetical protein